MELLYIWLGESKDKSQSLPFENQEICFSNEYLITHDNVNNKKHSFTVIVRNVNESEKSFYKIKEYEKLNNCDVNVSCFVGKNGAGKSLLLETIVNLLYRHETKDFLSKYNSYLIVWRENNKCYFDGKCVKALPSSIFSEKQFNSSSINVVFYSPYLSVLNSNKQYINRPNVFDISTSYLLENEKSKKLEKPYTDYRINNKDDIQDKLNVFNLSENERKILFYSERSNIKYLKDKFENSELLRNNYVITPSDFYWNLFYSDNDEVEKLYNKYLKELKDNGKKLLVDYFNKTLSYVERSKIKEEDKFNKLLWEYAKELWIIILSYATFGFELGKDTKYKRINVNFDSRKKITQYDFLCEYVNKLAHVFSGSFTSGRKDKIINLIIDFFSLISEFKDCLSKYEEQKLQIPLKDKKDRLKNLFKLLRNYTILKESLDNSDFLNFYFEPRYSCGEDSLITLYARLFDLFKIYNKKDNRTGTTIYDCKSILILVDEGEMGFHPEWSKKYLYALFNYIQYLINKYKPKTSKIENIHIIISTNSPIVISDVLSQDVFYMDNKHISKSCKFAFGANILDIYSEPFFINTGLIGRFAQEKINKVIEFIKSKDAQSIDIKKIKFIINNVGDPNIKSFLQTLFDNKCKNTVWE